MLHVLNLKSTMKKRKKVKNSCERKKAKLKTISQEGFKKIKITIMLGLKQSTSCKQVLKKVR